MLSSCRVTGSASSVRFFAFLISAFKCLVTSRPCSTSLRRCTVWVFLRATLNCTFMATTAWTALRRMLATTASAIVSSVVWMIGTKGWPEHPNCNNERVMVRLPDQCSTDRLATFSRRRHLLSVSIDQLGNADAPLISESRMYYISSEYNSLFYPPTASLGISSLSTTPWLSKTLRAFDRAHACTRRAQPYYTSLQYSLWAREKRCSVIVPADSHILYLEDLISARY
jgi:hypothetical protein